MFVNHNFGSTNALIAIPISGTVTVTIKNGSTVVGNTTTDTFGRWLSGFDLPTGSYSITFVGNFHPIGHGPESFYPSPTKQITTTIGVQDESVVSGNGASGPTGPAGASGPKGDQGPAGIGTQGITGPRGTAGAPGAPGSIGLTGPAGPAGSGTGSGGDGLTGPAGPMGITGPVGPVGTACDLPVGTPSDGYFSDGLFGWIATTPTCDALDDLNEILSKLAPQPAPSLSSINCTSTGVAGNLSFDATHAVSDYVACTGIGSDSPVSAAVLVDASFAASGNRRGIFSASSGATIVGTLADDIAAGPGSPTASYPANAFGDAETGSLILELNGTTFAPATVDLTDPNAVNEVGSGFVLSASTSTSFPDGSLFTSFKYRTGTWRVVVANMRHGWNYVRVRHLVGAVYRNTDYVDWIYDADTTATSFSSTALDNLSMVLGSPSAKYISGVQYHVSGTAQYDVSIANAQKNTWVSGNAITFTGTRCTVGATGFQNTVGDVDRIETITNKTVTVTNSSRILDSSIIVVTNADRTVQGDLSSSSSTISGILLDNTTATSTAVLNSFDDETYRINASSDFETNLTSNWTSTLSLVGADAGHNNGLQCYGGELIYPVKNFSAVTNGPAANPDYSGAAGTRYYFGYFTSVIAASNYVLSIGTASSASLVADSDLSASTNEVSICLRWPGVTGWLDVTVPFLANTWGDTGDAYNTSPTYGCYAETYGNDLTIPTTTLGVSIGTQSSANSYNKVYYRIKVLEGWTGSISSISITWNV
jgi:hypothetical protein